MQIVAMRLADRARIIGQKISGAVGITLGLQLNAGIAEFVGWPFVVSAGRVEDATGRATAPFACVVHIVTNGSPASDVIAADNAAVVIDVIEDKGQPCATGKVEKQLSPPTHNHNGLVSRQHRY